jgi:TrmH family RNA methyltransferase
MISKGLTSHIRSLRLKKFRDHHREFVAEGPKIALEVLNSSLPVSRVICTEIFSKLHEPTLSASDTEIIIVTDKDLDRVTNLTTPNQVIVIANYPQGYPSGKIKPEKMILALDRIQDPGNLGTIIRTADWFGFRQIICSSDTVDLFNPKVIQSTMGSFLRVQVSYTNLVDYLRNANDLNILGTYPEGQNIFHHKVEGESIIVIGNESQGISREVSELVQTKITIPSASSGSDSLNASMAASVIMAEFARKAHWQ